MYQRLVDGAALAVHGFVGAPDGTEVYRDVERGALAEAELLGHRLAARIQPVGAGSLLERLHLEAAGSS